MRKVTTVISPIGDPSCAVEIKIMNAPLYKRDRFVLEFLGSRFEILKQDMIAAIENATNWDAGEWYEP